MSMIQRRKRAVARTWLMYYVVADDRLRSGKSITAFAWDTVPILFVATVVAALTGRQWHGATEYVIRS